MENDHKHIDIVSLMARFFAGEATVEEQIILDKWKSSSKENQKEYDTFSNLWNFTGNISDKPSIDIDTEWYKLDNKITTAQTRVITIKRIIQIAAAVIVFSFIALSGYYQSRIVTQKNNLAEMLTVDLPDGSQVELNSQTKITYRKHFGLSHRNISLEGEAFFNVKKDSALPFIITANGAQIEVLGTSFNVKARKADNTVKVYVVEGTVTLYDKKQKKVKTLLTAGESGNYDKKQGHVKKDKVVSINDIAWKTRIIDLEDTPMYVVKEILESTYHREITLSENIKNCPVTASFKNDNIGTVLKVLEATLDLKITIDHKIITINGNGC